MWRISAAQHGSLTWEARQYSNLGFEAGAALAWQTYISASRVWAKSGTFRTERCGCLPGCSGRTAASRRWHVLATDRSRQEDCQTCTTPHHARGSPMEVNSIPKGQRRTWIAALPHFRARHRAIDVYARCFALASLAAPHCQLMSCAAFASSWNFAKGRSCWREINRETLVFHSPSSHPFHRDFEPSKRRSGASGPQGPRLRSVALCYAHCSGPHRWDWTSYCREGQSWHAL